MEKCPHVAKVNAKHHLLAATILNPAKWICSSCSTTDCVWVCLTCGHVACGRYIQEHAICHFQSSNHALVMEINERYVYCYACDNYVLNDSPRMDLLHLRTMLSAISFSRFSSSGRLLRSRSNASLAKDGSAEEADKSNRKTSLDDQMLLQFAVIKHRRLVLLNRILVAWRDYVRTIRHPEVCVLKLVSGFGCRVRLIVVPSVVRKQRRGAGGGNRMGADAQLIHEANGGLPLGVTGLRNLGNTCYVNSVLQVLGNLDPFRDFFLNNSEVNSDDHLALMDNTRPHSSSLTPLNGALSKKTLSLSREESPAYSDLRRSSRNTASSNSQIQLAAPRVQQSRRRALGAGGLNGGSTESMDISLKMPAGDKANESAVSANADSLKDEVYALLRVMWSGKLSLVIPYGFLQAMWNAIPSFRGYRQQDAQEFLCEMLDKLEVELSEKGSEQQTEERNNGKLLRQEKTERLRNMFGSTENNALHCGDAHSLVNQLFNGETISTVRCLECGNSSETVESFTDLSLEFPERYQNCRMTDLNLATETCHLRELVSAFTGKENLGQVYHCSNCNPAAKNVRLPSSSLERLTTSARRFTKQRNAMTSDNGKTKIPSANSSEHCTIAEKQILIRKLPDILRLHLKRFRWAGRSQREKISIHVRFDETLDLADFFAPGQNLARSDALYRLCAVIMHHGRGFNSGHYTAYCWNSKENIWIHCNDANLQLCALEDVLASQAYILFYQRCDLLKGGFGGLLEPQTFATGLSESQQMGEESTFSPQSSSLQSSGRRSSRPRSAALSQTATALANPQFEASPTFEFRQIGPTTSSHSSTSAARAGGKLTSTPRSPQAVVKSAISHVDRTRHRQELSPSASFTSFDQPSMSSQSLTAPIAIVVQDPVSLSPRSAKSQPPSTPQKASSKRSSEEKSKEQKLIDTYVDHDYMTTWNGRKRGVASKSYSDAVRKKHRP